MIRKQSISFNCAVYLSGLMATFMLATPVFAMHKSLFPNQSHFQSEVHLKRQKLGEISSDTQFSSSSSVSSSSTSPSNSEEDKVSYESCEYTESSTGLVQEDQESKEATIDDVAPELVQKLNVALYDYFIGTLKGAMGRICPSQIIQWSEPRSNRLLLPHFEAKDYSKYSKRIFLDNKYLSTEETMHLLHYMIDLLENDKLPDHAAEELRAVFAQVEFLAVSFELDTWGKSYGEIYTLTSLKKFISLFPNLNAIHVNLYGLTRGFEFPIPSTITQLRELVFVAFEGIGGTYTVPTEEKTRAWYHSWEKNILDVIERNKDLVRVGIETYPGAKVDFLERLGDLIKKNGKISKLTLFAPDRESRKTESRVRFSESDEVYYNAFKDILNNVSPTQLGEIRCVVGLKTKSFNRSTELKN